MKKKRNKTGFKKGRRKKVGLSAKRSEMPSKTSCKKTQVSQVMEVETADGAGVAGGSGGVLGVSGVSGGMPSVLEVVQERAREQQWARALAAGECEASDGSDSEAVLTGALAELRVPGRAPPPQPPAAAALAPRLARALALHPHPAAFLRDFERALAERDPRHLDELTDEIMRYVKEVACGGSAGEARVDGVVAAAWLALAAVWRAPRLPAAPRALHALARHLTPAQVEEVARALHATQLTADELMLLSDVVRGAGGAGGAGGGAALLAELLLRAALADVLATTEVAWSAGALSVEETTKAVGARWGRLAAPQQLQAARLAARVLAAAAAAAARGECGAAALLAAMPHPPPPLQRHDPDYIKVGIALTKMETLFNQNEKKAKKRKKSK